MLKAIEDLFDITYTEVLVLSMFVMTAIAIFIVALFYANRPDNKYEKVINPTYESRKRGDILGTKSENAIKKQLDRIARKNAFNKKIESLYIQAGLPGKGVDYFISQTLKFVVIGILTAVTLFVFLRNAIVSIVVFLAVSCLNFLDIYGNISERKRDFINEFPFFLKTLAFVLDNGANMATGFKEVVDKTKDGVLKEVMQDVMETEKVNGGDFTAAFHILPEKINCDETKEFVEIVQNNYDKGVPIAETFTSQSDEMDKLLQSKKNKRVKNLDNKMMLPLILIFAAVALLIWTGLGDSLMGGF